jgi:DNA-binding response OmpR family regulator
MQKILFVDDDEGLMDLLSFLVQRDGFRPILATNSSSALQLLEEERPDLLVLDCRLGAEDGLELLQIVRRFSQVPIIMLSSLDSEEEIERALELGADDYIIKPFAFREFVARIRALLRRTCAARSVETIDHWMHVGPLALNPIEHAATLDGLPVELTRIEFKLLHMLMENVNKVVPYCVLLKQVWDYDDSTATDVVRAALYRLRRKLVDTGSDQSLALRTVPGLGVMLQCGSERSEARRPEQLIEQYAPLRETLPVMVAA